VLRRVAASSALALALLGLGAQRASAKASEWVEGSLSITSAGPTGEPGPVFGDLDGDGDQDLVLSDNTDPPLRYFENTGTASSPDFVERTGGANPLLDVEGNHLRPALGDLDGDGDLDLVLVDISGVFSYYENTGSATAPSFVLRTGAQNPFAG